MISVCLCDAQPVVQEGLRTLLSRSESLELVAYCDSLERVDEAVADSRADVLIVDRGFGMHAVLELVGRYRHDPKRPRIVVWASSISDVECFKALQAGARGIMKKTIEPEALFTCLEAVADGALWTESIQDLPDETLERPRSRPLTPREREVAELVAKGMKNREIGEALGIATGTVKIHLMHIFEKTGIRDRFELALQGLRIATEQKRGGRRPDREAAPELADARRSA